MKKMPTTTVMALVILATIIIVSRLLSRRTAALGSGTGLPGRGTVEAPPSVVPTLILTITPLPTALPTSLPSATPGLADPGMWTPTPINVQALPSPQDGLVNAVGRLLCGDAVGQRQLIYIARIVGTTPEVVVAPFTDAAGYFFLQDAVPGTYTVLMDPTTTIDTASASTWVLEAGQTVDFGDVLVEASACRE